MIPAGPDPISPPGGARFSRPPGWFRRAFLHALGLLAAALVSWLIWRGYRQPGFILDFASLMVC